jgi:hypothetical protein
MASRRGRGPSISLFSFQDIITSVSGILIFVTLLLTLELTGRAQKAGSGPVEWNATDLERAIARVRAERDDLRRLTLRGTSPDARTSLELERKVREAEALVARAEQELSEPGDRTEVARHREAASRALTTETEEERRALDHQFAEVERLGQELGTMRGKDRIYYDIDPDIPNRAKGWLVLVDGASINVAPLAVPERPRSFQWPVPDKPTLEDDHALRDFLQWFDNEDPSKYILLVTRPSGITRARFIREVFRQTDRRFGMDLVSELQEVLDPLNGVFRP